MTSEAWERDKGAEPWTRRERGSFKKGRPKDPAERHGAGPRNRVRGRGRGSEPGAELSGDGRPEGWVDGPGAGQ